MNVSMHIKNFNNVIYEKDFCSSFFWTMNGIFINFSLKLVQKDDIKYLCMIQNVHAENMSLGLGVWVFQH